MEGNLQRQFGRNLRAYRASHGLSQEALADVLGVHRTYMGGVERGERNLTLRSVERLAERLGLEPLAMLGETAAPGSAQAPGPQLASECWLLQEGSCPLAEYQASGHLRLRVRLDYPAASPTR